MLLSQDIFGWPRPERSGAEIPVAGRARSRYASAPMLRTSPPRREQPDDDIRLFRRLLAGLWLPQATRRGRMQALRIGPFPTKQPLRDPQQRPEHFMRRSTALTA